MGRGKRDRARFVDIACLVSEKKALPLRRRFERMVFSGYLLVFVPESSYRFQSVKCFDDEFFVF